MLVGGGGHASDILAAYEAIARETGEPHPVIGIIDDAEVDMRRFIHRGVRQIGAISDLDRCGATHFILALGWPMAREAVAKRLTNTRLRVDTVIHPRAFVPPGVTVGDGAVVLANCVVSELAQIGCHAYLSHGTLIGHDTVIGDFASVMPGASISGDCSIGEGCLIGANATIIEGVRVGPRSTLGAGAVLTKNTPGGIVALGTPARWKIAVHAA